MNKDYYYKLDTESFKYEKKWNTIAIVSMFTVIFAFIIFVNLNLSTTITHIILYSIMILYILINLFAWLYYDKNEKNISKDKKLWVIKNEDELIKEVSISHEYEIVDFIYLKENSNPTILTKNTESFNYPTTLAEIVYLKDGNKHKMTIDVAVLNKEPKYIKYIEINKINDFYVTGYYNFICE